MTVAVLGAGLAGCGVALELANRGRQVVLFDRRQAPMQEASRWCEGKIHLGLVYANDRSFRTARTMIKGALSFTDALRRWIPLEALETRVSDPFDYAILKSSMLSTAHITAHFAKVEAEIHDQAENRGASYLQSLEGPVYRPVDPETAGYDSDQVIACYRTPERAIDTHWLADCMTDAVVNHPRIDVLMQHEILGVERNGNRFEVHCRQEGVNRRETGFLNVINALWANRLQIDLTMGRVPVRSAVNRLKLGVNVWEESIYPDMPSATFMLGAYGDSVRFPTGRKYLSWYPAGMFSMDDALNGVDWQESLARVNKQKVVKDTLEELSKIIPGIRSGFAGHDLADPPPGLQVEGGAIIAWGKTDIVDIGSELHQRHEIGPEYDDGYVSLEGGKLTTIPQYALQTAELISPSKNRRHFFNA